MDNKKIIGTRINSALALRGKKQKELATALKVTDNTISYFCNGSRTPNIQQLAEISRYLNVSSDYLLGLSPNPTTDKELDAVCRFTGLSQKSIKFLNRCSQWGIDYELKIIDILIHDAMYSNIENGKVHRGILNLLNFYFSYSNPGLHKQISINGNISDMNTTAFTGMNSLRLDDTVIENAVLVELQQALHNLKRNLQKMEGE